MVVASGFEVVFCHSNASVYVTGCYRDCSFVDNVACKAFTIKRAKVLVSAIACLSVVNLIAFIQDLSVVVFNYVGHVGCAAVADFKVVLLKILWSLCDLGKCLSIKRSMILQNLFEHFG